MKTFETEFDRYLALLKSGENFSFQRFADGEQWILEGREFGLSPSEHGYLNEEDWKYFHPVEHSKQREHLMDALCHKDEKYHVGLLVGNSQINRNKTDFLLKLSEQPIENVTYANLFVNANYARFRTEFVPELLKRELVVVCNRKSTVSFPNVRKVFTVGSNCIVNDYDLVDRICDWTLESKTTGCVYLFCCSSLGNFCIRNLAEVAPSNVYLDCGSTLNKDLGLSLDRAYLSHAHNVLYRNRPAPPDTSIVDEDYPWKS